MESYEITENLWSHEVMCPCCGVVKFKRRFVNKVQILRDIIGIPFYYKKGGFYRCQLYNRSLPNSSKTSQHPKCLACDISTHNFTGNARWQLVNEAMKLGFSIGIYTAHIHLDDRDGPPVLFVGTY